MWGAHDNCRMKDRNFQNQESILSAVMTVQFIIGGCVHTADATRLSCRIVNWAWVYYAVSQKTHQLWNGIAQNYRDGFWWHLVEIFKILQNRDCMLQFSCRFAFFINFSSFKQDTKNNANFANYASHCLSRWRRSVKKTKFWSKFCMNVKVTMLGSL